MTGGKNIDAVDAFKLILSLLVAAIHVNPLDPHRGGLIYPWARLAVPIFFILNGYFLWKSILATQPGNERSVVQKYVRRNILLYLGWFILLLPSTLWIRNYFALGLRRGIVEFLNSLLLGSTFRASWFLTAAVEAVLLTRLLSKKLSNRLLFALYGLIYALCCLYSVYANTRLGTVLVSSLGAFCPPNSFLAALLWILIGKWLAERSTLAPFPAKPLPLTGFLLLSLALLKLEHRMVLRLGLTPSGDCYFMLIPAAILAVLVVLRISVRVPHARLLRHASVVTFCMHANLGDVLRSFLSQFSLPISLSTAHLLLYIGVLLICFCTTLLLEFASRRFKFLQALY